MPKTRRVVSSTASRSTPRLRGDLHVHVLHDGLEFLAGTPVSTALAAGKRSRTQLHQLAQTVDAEYLAVVQHASSPLHPRVADHHTNALLADQLQANLVWNAERPKGAAELLSGIETIVLSDGTLDVDFHVLAHADLVVVARHGGPTQSTGRIVTAMCRAVALPHIDVLGSLGRYETQLSPSQWEQLIVQAARTKTAVGVTLRQPLPAVALELVARHGALVALGSDSHGSSYANESLVLPGDRAATALLRQVLRAGIEPKRVLNTWSLADLQGWLSSRKEPKT